MGAPFFWDERPHPSLRRHLPQRRRQGRGSRGAALLDNHGADVPPKPSPLGKVPKADEVGSAAEKIKPGSVHCEGVKGATAKPPCRARRRDSPCNKKDQQQENHVSRCWSVAPIWRDNVRVVGKAAWGASADAQSYWQGRFAACTFVGCVWRNGHPRNSWGVAPNPTRELRPLTPQGGFPLDPFLATWLGRASLIELFSGFSFTFYPVPKCSAGSASP